MNYFQIAVNFPVKESVLTYASDFDLQRGDCVEVPLGRRKSGGVVLRNSTEADLKKIEDLSIIKKIHGFIPNSFTLSEKEIELYEWMAKYYHYSLGKLIFDCLPKFLKRPQKAKFVQGLDKELPFDLTETQTGIYQEIQNTLANGFSKHYIHGVTGSGKSYIYLNLIKEVISKGQNAQFLLPEINLTPQFVKIFEEYLGVKVLSYHSGVTASQKYNIWKELKSNEGPFLIMGVRSSIFLPIDNLGLVIVDEEHDASFKQTDRCPYNGRDVAIKKAQIFNVPVVLGSATPTMENYKSFHDGGVKAHYYQLPDRVGGGHFPKLRLLDAKNKFSENDNTYPILQETLKSIEKRVEAKEQVLVFINKLGYSHFIQCRSCGHQFKNDKCGCDNNLRYFKSKKLLSCAHCEFKMPLPDVCPDCGSMSLLNKGFGTEKIESVLQNEFPDYKVERFDRDEITNLKQLNDKLDRFNNHEIDILVGTQMLAKGHNFERVNLVVMLGMDNMLNYADFRSSEKMFQLTKQVAGRAGRFSADSEVIIQTMNPHHTIFEFIQSPKLDAFYQDELGLREICFCPPYTKMAMIYFNSRFRDRAIQESSDVASSLRKVISDNFGNVRLLGPAPNAIEKKANQFTWSLMLKSEDINQLHQVLSTFEQNYSAPSNVSFKIDVDPI